MVSLRVFAAAGERYATLALLAERSFEAAVFALRGFLLPPVAVEVDASLLPGRFVVAVNGERGPLVSEPLMTQLWRDVESNGAALLDLDGTRALLDLLHDESSVLVEAVHARFDLPFVHRRLQALLSDRIPITDLRAILESLLAVRGLQQAPPQTDEASLCLSEDGYDREVRAGLRHLIAWPHLRQGGLAVHLVQEHWRAALAAPLSSADTHRLRAAVAAALGDQAEAVLLTDSETRWPLRNVLAPHWPRVTVLAFTDLPPDMDIRTLTPIA